MIGMDKGTLNIGLTTALLIALPACASHKPSLHPNEHLMQVGSSVADVTSIYASNSQKLLAKVKRILRKAPLARRAALLIEQPLAVQAVQWSARPGKAQP
jgi:hypothetical protein